MVENEKTPLKGVSSNTELPKGGLVIQVFVSFWFFAPVMAGHFLFSGAFQGGVTNGCCPGSLFRDRVCRQHELYLGSGRKLG